MRRKRILSFAVVTSAFLLAGIYYAPSLARPLVIKAVHKSVPGSTVRIGRLSWSGFGSIRAENVFFGLAQGSRPFPKLGLTTGKRSDPLAGLLRTIEVHGLVLDIRTSDLTLKGSLSFSRDLKEDRWRSLEMRIESLRAGAIDAKDVQAGLPVRGQGSFSVDSLSLGKITVRDIRGSLRFTDEFLELGTVTAGLWESRLAGSLRLTLSPGLQYAARLTVSDLPVSAVMKNFEWDKKCSANGILNGEVRLEGVPGKVTLLDGGLTAAPPGGDIVILDPDFFQRIADSAKQPVEIVKASFENYHYNTGTVGLSLVEQNVRLNFQLDGEKGKRDLEVTLHDML